MKNIHGGNIYKIAAAHGVNPQDIVDFSANINPQGLSPKGKEALLGHVEEVIHYPDPNNEALLEVAAKLLTVPKDNILFGNGAAQLLYALMELQGIAQVLVPAPGFSEYALAAMAQNIKVQSYSLRLEETPTYHFEVPYDVLREHLVAAKENNTQTLLCLGNPNNPDGSLQMVNEVIELAKLAEESGSLLLVDESFIEFTNESHSLRPYIEETPNILVLHSFTKFYAIPGLRLGALLGQPQILNTIKQFIPAWSVNHLAAQYGIGALQDEVYRQKSRAVVAREKEWLYGAIKVFHFLTVLPPSVNFMLLHWQPESPSLQDFMEFLETKNLLIRSCEAYEGLGTGWFRIAVKDRANNELLISYVKEFAHAHNLFSTSRSN